MVSGCVALLGCRGSTSGDEVGGETATDTSTSTSTSTTDTSTSTSTTDTGTSTTNSSTDTSTDTTSTDTSTTDTTDASTTDTSTTDTSTTDTSTTDTSSTTGEPIVCMGPEVPIEAALLLDWLEGGNYLQWQAESGPHPSTGPHFGDVRTFVHPCLAESLDANQLPHSVGAAAVKELYGAGDVVLGWSVMVKIAEGGGDETWYWYERFEGNTTSDAIGDPICSECHNESGFDKFASYWPLI